MESLRIEKKLTMGIMMLNHIPLFVGLFFGIFVFIRLFCISTLYPFSINRGFLSALEKNERKSC
jgi:hypothetical protein